MRRAASFSRMLLDVLRHYPRSQFVSQGAEVSLIDVNRFLHGIEQPTEKNEVATKGRTAFRFLVDVVDHDGPVLVLLGLDRAFLEWDHGFVAVIERGLPEPI